MSENRTSNLPDVSPFTTLLAAIDTLAVKCARTMKTRLPDNYRQRRSSIGLSIDTMIMSSDGSLERLRTDPVTVTGWYLLTEPYFISDTRNDAAPAVFITGHGFEPTVISREYFADRDRRPNLFPRRSSLQDVHRELTMILAPS